MGFVFQMPARWIDGGEASMFKPTPKSISEAYHRSKADGSNPELVKAVEDLLNNPQEQKAEPKSPLETKYEQIQPTKEGKGDGSPKEEVNKQPIGEAKKQDVEDWSKM